METIVENNKSLEWIGWDVVELQKSPTGWMKPEGILRNGEWFIQKRYNVESDGWDIPNKFVRNNGK
jgi:hypothetical protein